MKTNQFVELFADKIKYLWEAGSEDDEQKLFADILQYANSNTQSFQKEIEDVMFDKELTPLSIILEALSKDTDTWGQLYIDILDKIFTQAKQVEKPQDILSNLSEFAFIEKEEKPFVQKIVDRLYKETESDNLLSKLAAIWILPAFLANPSIRNKSLIADSLQQKLYDKNWQVRYVSFKSLGYEDMLPNGYHLSMADKIRKMILGIPISI